MRRRASMTGVVLTSAALMAATGLARADLLILDNADRITGSFTEQSGGTVHFQPRYTDATLSVPVEKVSGLQTENNIRILLDNGDELVGQAVQAADGELRILSNEMATAVTVQIAAIQSIASPRTPPPETVRTSGHVNVGGSLTRGNTKTEAANANADFEARGRLNRFRAAGEINRAQDDEELSKDNARLASRFDSFLSERVYLNSSLSLDRDRFRNLRLRTTVGVGVGYQFYDTARRMLSAEIGASYVREDYYDTEGDGSNPAARWAIDYEEKLSASMTFFHTQEGLQNLDQSELLLRTRTGLRFPLIAGINGTLQFNVDYEADPAAEVSQTDTAFLITAGYSW